MNVGVMILPSKDAFDRRLMDTQVGTGLFRHTHPFGPGVEISENNRVQPRDRSEPWVTVPTDEQYESD